VVTHPAVDGEFFNTAVEKFAEECNYSGPNRIARSEYEIGGGVIARSQQEIKPKAAESLVLR